MDGMKIISKTPTRKGIEERKLPEITIIVEDIPANRFIIEAIRKIKERRDNET